MGAVQFALDDGGRPGHLELPIWREDIGGELVTDSARHGEGIQTPCSGIEAQIGRWHSTYKPIDFIVARSHYVLSESTQLSMNGE